MGLTGDQVAIIGSTWNALLAKTGGDKDQLGKEFFLKMFEVAPDTKPVFKHFKDKSQAELTSTDIMKSHGGKVISKLGEMVAALGDAGKLGGMLGVFGKQHKGLNVAGSYMPKGGAGLVALMKLKLGDDFSGAAEGAWVALIEETKKAIDSA